jgi:hypothetical protein
MVAQTSSGKLNDAPCSALVSDTALAACCQAPAYFVSSPTQTASITASQTSSPTGSSSSSTTTSVTSTASSTASGSVVSLVTPLCRGDHHCQCTENVCGRAADNLAVTLKSSEILLSERTSLIVFCLASWCC